MFQAVGKRHLHDVNQVYKVTSHHSRAYPLCDKSYPHMALFGSLFFPFVVFFTIITYFSAFHHLDKKGKIRYNVKV